MAAKQRQQDMAAEADQDDESSGSTTDFIRNRIEEEEADPPDMDKSENTSEKSAEEIRDLMTECEAQVNKFKHLIDSECMNAQQVRNVAYGQGIAGLTYRQL